MPWKETVVLEERMRFVLACLESLDSMAVLCRRFGISRRHGYKWLERYERLGPAGLTDQSRRPLSHPQQVPQEVNGQILACRRAHPTWGPRKLRTVLQQQDGNIQWPAPSTIGDLLRRSGLSVGLTPRPRSTPSADPLGEALAANRIWCADFKGHFCTGDGRRCDPLTVTDAYSRYLLRCTSVAKMDYGHVRSLFEATFRRYGLPEAIRTDNGQPFASVGLAGLSRLSIWWVRLGINLQRIAPGCPQQNGKHERMHRTLKAETATPAAPTLAKQQRKFDAWVKEFNFERPHEALAMATPASYYQKSPRAYPERLAELEYGSDYQTRKVDAAGYVRWKVAKVFVSNTLWGQVLGLRQVCDRYHQVKFGPIDLGLLDERNGRLLSASERRRLGM
jgi:transposase InsO family protein